MRVQLIFCLFLIPSIIYSQFDDLVKIVVKTGNTSNFKIDTIKTIIVKEEEKTYTILNPKDYKKEMIIPKQIVESIDYVEPKSKDQELDSNNKSILRTAKNFNKEELKSRFNYFDSSNIQFSLIYKEKIIENLLLFSPMDIIVINELFLTYSNYLFLFKGNDKFGKEIIIPNNLAKIISKIPMVQLYVTDLDQVYKLGHIKPFSNKELSGYSSTAYVKSIYEFSKLEQEYYIVISIFEDIFKEHFISNYTFDYNYSDEISNNNTFESNYNTNLERSNFSSQKNEDLNSNWVDINTKSIMEIKSGFNDNDYDIKEIRKIVNSNSRNKWAIVISNKNYVDDGIIDVDFAYNDGVAIVNYLRKSFGYLENNIVWVKDATKSKLEELFGNERIQNGLLSNLVNENDEILIYYSGHGAPGGPQDPEPYLVPVDCSSNFINIMGYPLEIFYRNINEIKAKKKTIILDACFSGKDVIKNVSSVGIKVNSQPFIEDPNTFIFTSSKSEEVSNWFVEKENSLFTYYFLKSINEYSKTDLNRDGKLSYQEIYNSLMDKSFGLPYATRRLSQPIQTPQLLTAGNPNTSFF